MARFSPRQPSRANPLLLGVLALVLAALVFFVGRGAWRIWRTETATDLRRRAAERERAELEERREFLEAEVARLRTEEGVEARIRETLGFGKAGEGVIIVVNPDRDAGDRAAGESVWSRLKAFFGRE